MSSEEAEITAEEALAREMIQGLIRDGYAQDLMATWSYCSQSCNYVYGILVDIANADSGISDEIVNFARNLLDDWSK
jgi:hypothetical protein